MIKKKAEGHNAKYYNIAGLNKFLKIYYAHVTELYRSIDKQLIFGTHKCVPWVKQTQLGTLSIFF
jgi:hypothetical protein